jgi:hypothetical protein
MVQHKDNRSVNNIPITVTRLEEGGGDTATTRSPGESGPSRHGEGGGEEKKEEKKTGLKGILQNETRFLMETRH